MTEIKTVLIDSDQPSLIRLQELLAKFNGIEILGTFENSNEGLDFILENEPDIVFIQIEMPNLSGLDVADEISKRETDIKIILVSNHSHYAIKALRISVFDYLVEPIDIDE